MPITAGAGAAIAAGVSAASTMGTNAWNAGRTRKQREWMEKMWRMQNAYNTPLSQMSRYREAGLNPALMYGQGTSGNADKIGTYQDSRMEAPDVTGALSKYTAAKQAEATVENIKADTDKKRTEAWVAAQSVDADIMKRQSEGYLAFNKRNLQVLESRIKEANATSAVLDATYKEYRNKLWKDNKMTMGDATMLRMFTGFLSEIGISTEKIATWSKKFLNDGNNAK